MKVDATYKKLQKKKKMLLIRMIKKGRMIQAGIRTIRMKPFMYFTDSDCVLSTLDMLRDLPRSMQ